LYTEDGYAKAMNDLDRAILTHFGIPKNNNEPTTEYFKRASKEKETKSLQDREAELAGEITDLKEKLKAKPGDERLIKELEDLKAEKAKIPDLIEEKVNEWKKKYEDTNKEYETFKTKSQLEKLMPKLRDDIDPEYRNFKIESVMQKILQSKEIQKTDDGKILIYDPSNHDRTPADVYLAQQFDSIAFKATQQNGGGAGKKADGGDFKPGSSTLKFDEGTKDPDKYNQIKEYLGTQEGLDKFDPKYSSRLNELCAEHGLTSYVVTAPTA